MLFNIRQAIILYAHKLSALVLPWKSVKQSSDSCFDDMKCFVPFCLRPDVCHSLDSGDKKHEAWDFHKEWWYLSVPWIQDSLMGLTLPS